MPVRVELRVGGYEVMDSLIDFGWKKTWLMDMTKGGTENDGAYMGVLR